MTPTKAALMPRLLRTRSPEGGVVMLVSLLETTLKQCWTQRQLYSALSWSQTRADSVKTVITMQWHDNYMIITEWIQLLPYFTLFLTAQTRDTPFVHRLIMQNHLGLSQASWSFRFSPFTHSEPEQQEGQLCPEESPRLGPLVHDANWHSGPLWS